MNESYKGVDEMGVIQEPVVLGVTDLGGNNQGTISAADLTPEAKEQLIQEAARPEYRRVCSYRRFRCVDGRVPVGGLRCENEETADPQTAGGEAVLHPSVDYMLEPNSGETVGQKTARHTQRVIAHGRDVVVHGDTHKGKEGCGAAVKAREVLRNNAKNIDKVTPKAWDISVALELDQFGLTKEDLTQLVVTGKENAENEVLWEATPEERIEIAITNGAVYEEMEGEHNEKAILVDVSEHAFNEEQFMNDHVDEHGKPLQAFVATMGALKKIIFEDAAKEGHTEREASLRMAGAILFNIGVPKELTAEEQGNGEALQVVVLGNK